MTKKEFKATATMCLKKIQHNAVMATISSDPSYEMNLNIWKKRLFALVGEAFLHGLTNPNYNPPIGIQLVSGDERSIDDVINQLLQLVCATNTKY